MNEKHLEHRITTLEKKFEEMFYLIKDMKNSFDKFADFASGKTTGPIHSPTTTAHSRVLSTPMAGTYERGPNPWALKSAQNLFTYDIGKQIIDGAFATYKPTIDALLAAPRGLTAIEVSQITGRARNTEAAYLKKLQRAGFAKREQLDGKAIYRLVEADRLPEVFGNR